jgi:hypothetical protein
MHQEVGKTIGHYAKPYGLLPPNMIDRTKSDKEHAGYGKNDKKCVIFFKKTGFNLVVVTVQIPQESMHNPLMSSPGYPFHNQKCTNHNKNKI